MLVRRVDGAVQLTEVETMAALRAKMRAFKALYGAMPRVNVAGWFTDLETRDPVHIDYECAAAVGTRMIRVELGVEGVAVLGADDLPNVRIMLRAP